MNPGSSGAEVNGSVDTDPVVDRALEIVNETGFPFQHQCADAIAGYQDFAVSMEVPYTYPQTNGPLLGVHGQADLIAVAPALTEPDALMVFVVECKRANDKIKNWLLMTNPVQAPRWPTLFTSLDPESPPQLMSVNRAINWPELGYETGAAFDYCINGVEVNSDFRALNRNSEDKLYRPLQQVAHAAMAIGAMYPKIIEGIDYFRTFERPERIYLPVVLTTARLYKIGFTPELVHDGAIPTDDFELGEPQKWLTYEFPLADYLGGSVERPNGPTHIPKRTIFIVNSEHLAEFFKAARSPRLQPTPVGPTAL